jgi:hypothetical protein
LKASLISLSRPRLGVAQREGFSASPVAVDGKVFFTNDDALADGRSYIRTERSLIAIGR